MTIRFNLFSDLVYENKFESQLCMIYDSNKRLCGTSNAFPFRYGYKLKLDKGDFTAKIQVFLYVCRLNRVVLCNYIKKGCGISKSKKYLRLSPYSISVRYIEMKRHLDVWKGSEYASSFVKYFSRIHSEMSPNLLAIRTTGFCVTLLKVFLKNVEFLLYRNITKI